MDCVELWMLTRACGLRKRRSSVHSCVHLCRSYTRMDPSFSSAITLHPTLLGGPVTSSTALCRVSKAVICGSSKMVILRGPCLCQIYDSLWLQRCTRRADIYVSTMCWETVGPQTKCFRRQNIWKAILHLGLARLGTRPKSEAGHQLLPPQGQTRAEVA